MAFINPEKVVFETTDDIVDYVSKGIAPRRKDFNRVMRCINNPMTDDEIDLASQADVVIPESIFMDIDREQFKDVLTRVYRNNCRKRNAIAVGVGVGAIIALTVGIKHARATNERDERINEYIDRWMVENDPKRY